MPRVSSSARPTWPRRRATSFSGKTFDNGVLCSSPNSVVVEASIAEEAKREFEKQGGYFLKPAEADALAKVLISPQRLPNPKLVGKSALFIAEQAGVTVPDGTRALLAPLAGVGRDFPLSIEKLCPVLSYYVVDGWLEGCERCIQILRYGGMGHTMSIHSQNEPVILEFGLKKPAFRICVNTPTTHGSIGLTTGLDPAMTLGCGGYGGNITSDNISPRHLLNIKRLAYELRPAVPSRRPGCRRPRAATPAGAGPTDRVGCLRPSGPPRRSRPIAQSPAATTGGAAGDSRPVEFVCEEDVRLAMNAGQRITHRRPDHHHACGARPRRGPQDLHRGELAAPGLADHRKGWSA